MVEAYYKLIKAGLRTIDQVLPQYKVAVQALLDKVMFSFIFKALFNMLGGDNMIDAYVTLIIAHRRTINQVLPQFKDAVMADLTALGLDGYGNPIVIVE